jgi:CRISPR/Cas system-associated exonuclease Cas4 (RecB family)
MNVKLSASKLNLLRECPRCFWLAMVKDIMRPCRIMPSLPIKVDSIIKEYYNKHRKQNELPPILNGQINGRLAVNMPKTLYHTEENGITLCGRPDDFIVLNNGTIAALDNKSKSRPPDNIHDAYRLQLNIYNYLLVKNGYNAADKGFLVYYSPDTSDLLTGMVLRCTIKEVTADPMHVISMIHQAEDILKEPTPPRFAEQCEFCKWIQTMSNNNFT